jgi:hypothetical protein
MRDATPVCATVRHVQAQDGGRHCILVLVKDSLKKLKLDVRLPMKKS